MLKYKRVPVAQWIEQSRPKGKIGGSTPLGDATNKIEDFYVAETFNSSNYYVSQMYYVYLLKSLKDESLYISYTSNLRKRLTEHNNGLSLYTKSKRPYKLMYYEAFMNRIDAKDRESYLKSGWGFRSIKKILKRSLT